MTISKAPSLKNEIGLIIPSTGRPREAFEALASAYDNAKANPGTLDVAVVLDDAEEWDAYIDAGVGEMDLMLVSRSTKRGFVEPVNKAAAGFLWGGPRFWPKYIGFMGDDHRVRTRGWVQMVLDRNEAFVYGDDLFQGENLPTAVFIRSDVINALGYFAPPVLQHLYADNAWLELGRSSDSIVYLPNLIIEHMHPAAGKGVMDELKAELNADTMKSRDERAFTRWMYSDEFNRTVEAIKRVCATS